MAERTKPGQIRRHRGFLKADGVKALWPKGEVRVTDVDARTRGVWEVR